MKIKQTVLAIALLIGSAGFAVVPTASAATSCGGVATSIISCDQKGGSKNAEDSGVWGILLVAINVLTAGVGVAALGGIVYGSVIYTMAGGSPEQAKKAKMIIFNTVIGILVYALLFAFLNFLIPGGLFT